MSQNSTGMIPSLCEIYKDYFPIGAAVSPDVIQKTDGLIKKHFNSLTPENDMKFQIVHPEEEVFKFDNADQIVNFALQNRMKVRGHNLVWHLTPDWLFKGPDGERVSREVLLERLERHIKTVVGRYRGKVYCWDVINEAVEDDDRPELLRDTEWLEIIGEDYLNKAFQWAHEADPDALLFYNDYAAEVPAKRDKIVKLIKKLKDQGVPIHAIGIQGHWHLGELSFDDLRYAIEFYASLGLQVQITELDLSFYSLNDLVSRYPKPTTAQLELLANTYSKIFNILREYKQLIAGVSFWGVTDDQSWLNYWPVNRNNWPLLFDSSQQPKEAFWAITYF
jgi:endo-1,4-beta-xylanase